MQHGTPLSYRPRRSERGASLSLPPAPQAGRCASVKARPFTGKIVSFTTIPAEVALMQNGSVVKLCSDEHYGVIETPDGHLAYFSSDCVARDAGGFGALRVGDQVSFAHEEAEQGMRATSVHRRGDDRRTRP